MSTRQNDQSNDQHRQAVHSSEFNENRRDSARSRVLGSPADIICGRGFHIANHHGNMNLHLMVNNYRELYLSSKRDQKAKIIKLVLDEIKSTGARFIRRVSNPDGIDQWEEVDDETAYKKVSHALRLRTTNESNRDGNGSVPSLADLIRPPAGSNTNDANKPRATCTTVPGTSTQSPAEGTSARPLQSTHPTDIICGRGFHIVNHRGNLNLHLMVNARRDEYLKSHRAQKAKIIKHIMDEIKSSGARFIRRVSDGTGDAEWEVVDDETAYKKVSHALRLRTNNESNRQNCTEASTSQLHQQGQTSKAALNQRGHELDGSSSTSIADESAQQPIAIAQSIRQVPASSVVSTGGSPLGNGSSAPNGSSVVSANPMLMWTPAWQNLTPPSNHYMPPQQFYNLMFAMLQQLSHHPNR